MRYLIVGDVHGCINELTALVDRHGEGRQVVLVGDLVAKGPDSKAVVTLARNRGFLAVRGNHDQHVLNARARHASGEKPRLSTSHAEVVATLEDDDWAFLESLPLWLRLNPELLVVHGGLVPGRPIERQDPNLLMNLRTIGPDGHGSKKLHGGVPWASAWPGPEHVVFGHDAIRGLQRYPYATGLDTGCVYGNALSGMLWPERTIVEEPARQTWCRPGEAR